MQFFAIGAVIAFGKAFGLQSLTPMKNDLRIVSLISSSTEILCKLGLESQIVGISHECDYPESIKTLPVCSAPKLNPNQFGKDIHDDVQRLIKQGLSIYDIKTDVLEKLAPDLIVTQDQCQVCAVSLSDVEKAVCHLTQHPAKICTLVPHTLEDIAEDFLRIGEATGKTQEAKSLKTEFWIHLNQINAKVGTHGKYRPRVLCIEWLDPLIIAGSWLPEITRLAGCDPLLVTEQGPFKTVTWQEARECNPDFVLIFPCGYGIEKTMDEIKKTSIKSELLKFSATQNGRTFVCDGNNYFNRPGPRISDTCEMIARLTHPDKFMNHENKILNRGYQPLLRKDLE